MRQRFSASALLAFGAGFFAVLPWKLNEGSWHPGLDPLDVRGLLPCTGGQPHVSLNIALCPWSVISGGLDEDMCGRHLDTVFPVTMVDFVIISR